jgi:CBS domain containing-hemolysin-like protein
LLTDWTKAGHEMNSLEIALRLLAGLALVPATGFFVAIEFALTVEEIRAEEWDREDVAAPPMTVAVGTSVSDVIDRFQAEGQELALAVADGGVRGLVTATDALETAMGDIEDPLDRDVMD